MAPGRWNQAGEEAIYTSTEMGVPLLERLAHTPKDLIPSNLALMKIQVSGDWKVVGNSLTDLRTGGSLQFYRSLSEAKSVFQNAQSFEPGAGPFAIALPSVIVPVWNVVLYPRGTAFWEHVSLESVELFEYDSRLFADHTPVEAEE